EPAGLVHLAGRGGAPGASAPVAEPRARPGHSHRASRRPRPTGTGVRRARGKSVCAVPRAWHPAQEPGGGVALVGVERRELALRLYLAADQSCRTDELPPVEAARWGVAAAMSLRVGDLAGVDTRGPAGGRRPDSDHERRGGIRDGVPGVLAGGATACRT